MCVSANLMSYSEMAFIHKSHSSIISFLHCVNSTAIFMFLKNKELLYLAFCILLLKANPRIKKMTILYLFYQMKKTGL